jgi:hypothetical protein
VHPLVLSITKKVVTKLADSAVTAVLVLGAFGSASIKDGTGHF